MRITTLIILSFNLICASLFCQYNDTELILEASHLNTESIVNPSSGKIITVHTFIPTIIFKGNSSASDTIEVVINGGVLENSASISLHGGFNIYPGFKYILFLNSTSNSKYSLFKFEGSYNRFVYADLFDSLNRLGRKTNSNRLNCSNDNELQIEIDEVTVDALSNQIHLDLKMKTEFEPSLLNSLSLNVGYGTGVFNSPLSNSVAFISFTNDVDYVTNIESVSASESRFELEYDNSVVDGDFILIDTISTIPVRFTFDASNINISSINSNSLTFYNVQANYNCGGRILEYNVFIDQDDISINIPSISEGITYAFGNAEYNPTVQFFAIPIYATSTSNTRLEKSEVYITYNDAVIQQYIDTINNGNEVLLVNDVGYFLQNDDSYSVSIENVNESTFKITLQIDPGSDLESYKFIGVENTPLYILNIRVESEDCDPLLGPDLEFVQSLMIGESSYLDESFPLPIVYSPLSASDFNNSVACADCNFVPIIDSLFINGVFISGNPQAFAAVAGANDTLTIKGSNFGTYYRTNMPGVNGSGSSILFTNGDGGSGVPTYIAAGERDLYWNGQIHWTDTSISVIIPSTDYLKGVVGPAASGKIRIRNICNRRRTSSNAQRVYIKYAKFNFRRSSENYSYPIGLLSEYKFKISNSPIWNETTAQNRLQSAILNWCTHTDINLKIDSSFTSLAPVAISGDEINSFTIENISSENALAAVIVGEAYLEYECGLSNFDRDGGYFMSELDVKIDPDFWNIGSTSQVVNALTHEIGHAHMLNHVRVISGANPMMYYTGASNLSEQDIEGGNEIFATSDFLIDEFSCVDSDNEIVNLSPITTALNCGSLVSNHEITSQNKIYVAPNPFTGVIKIFGDISIDYIDVLNVNGVSVSKTYFQNITSPTIYLNGLPSGSYFLKVVSGGYVQTLKVIKI